VPMKKSSFLRDASIKTKLILICICTTASALLVAGLISIAAELISFRYSMIDSLTATADTIGSNVKAALTFGDNEGAREILSTLDSQSSITDATLYDKNGNVFAMYRRKGTLPAHGFVAPGKNAYHVGLDHVDLYRQITLDGEIIGTVYIQSDMKHFYARVIRYVYTLFAVITLSLILSYLLFTRLQKTVTGPILELSRLMKAISGSKDYSLRAVVKNSDEIGSLAEGFNQMVANIEARNAELEEYRKNLEDLVRKRTAQLTDANDQLHQELTERLRAEKALVDSEYQYRTMFETSGNANMMTEGDGTIIMVNSTFERLSGYPREDIEGKMTWMDFFRGEDLERMKHYDVQRRANPESVPRNYETHFVDREGGVRNVYLSAAIIPGSTKAVGSFLDLTDLKKLEAQLLQSQKIEAIGQLAGGVAHDFNNILTAIIGYASLLRMDISANDPHGTYIDSILSSAEKATHLTQGLLAFSRKQVIAPKAIDLNEVIQKVEKLLARLMGEDIELKTTCNEKPVMVFADQGQIEQVLINLATNARDAMIDGGFFSITTGSIPIENSEAGTQKHEGDERCALITVSDTGAGIDKKAIEHIFEPFYTTKEVGKGTGLGLSIVYGIIKQHNGNINVYSEPGSGTTFKIYLPLIRSKTDEEEAGEARVPTGGNETILLAEDNAPIRGLITQILAKYGYRVLAAEDGDDALAQFTEHKGRIDLVILDVIMPKKNGRVVYDILKATSPDIRVLFISGYTADIVHKKGIFEEDIDFLFKPIMPDALLLKVRDMLDA
jgi:PAS domain S-box-containing protein